MYNIKINTLPVLTKLAKKLKYSSTGQLTLSEKEYNQLTRELEKFKGTTVYISFWDMLNNWPASYIGQLVTYDATNEIMIPVQITTRESGEVEFSIRFSLDPNTKIFKMNEY